MNMINQALGLDEIEAELNGGGEDIHARETSLTETDTGLQETQDQAAQEQERNQQTMDQADVNITDSQTTQEEGQALLAELDAHNEMLQMEEASGATYIVDFGSRYQPFFEQESQMSEGAAPAEASSETSLSEAGGSDALAPVSGPSSEPAEMSEESVA
jgi:septal ring factor EnvC (AmiA/AmiB activator)